MTNISIISEVVKNLIRGEKYALYTPMSENIKNVHGGNKYCTYTRVKEVCDITPSTVITFSNIETDIVESYQETVDHEPIRPHVVHKGTGNDMRILATACNFADVCIATASAWSRDPVSNMPRYDAEILRTYLA